jgi:hypothetical protein
MIVTLLTQGGIIMTFDYFDYETQFPNCLGIIEELLIRNFEYETLSVIHFMDLLEAYKRDDGIFDLDDLPNDPESDIFLRFIRHPNQDNMYELRAAFIQTLKTQLDVFFVEMFEEVKTYLHEARLHDRPCGMDAYRMEYQKRFAAFKVNPSHAQGENA